METILDLIVLLLHWRLTLSILASVALALILSSLIAPFTAGYCITLVIFGTTFGLYWQGRGEAGLSLGAKVEEPKISRPVAFMGLAIIGFWCGGMIAELLHSKALGAIALVAGVGAVSIWYRFAQQRLITSNSLAFSALSLLCGYGALLAFLAFRAT
jgi:hypothetical protein